MAITQTDIDYALKVQSQYGVPASVTLAAYQVESGAGTSPLSKASNNFFSIMWTGSGDYYQGSTRKWRKYATKWDSFEDFGKLLSGKKYSALTAGSKNVEEYIHAYADTYAPATENYNYAETLINVIYKNNLTQYDTGLTTTGTVETTETTTPETEQVKVEGFAANLSLVLTLVLLFVIGGLCVYKSFT